MAQHFLKGSHWHQLPSALFQNILASEQDTLPAQRVPTLSLATMRSGRRRALSASPTVRHTSYHPCTLSNKQTGKLVRTNAPTSRLLRCSVLNVAPQDNGSSAAPNHLGLPCQATGATSDLCCISGKNNHTLFGGVQSN